MYLVNCCYCILYKRIHEPADIHNIWTNIYTSDYEGRHVNRQIKNTDVYTHTSNKMYVGRIGRRFSTWYKEHKAGFHNNSNTSSFAKHLIEESHSFGPMNNIMQIVHFHRKGDHLNTIERLNIHTEFAANNHLNDPQTIFPNAISHPHWEPTAINLSTSPLSANTATNRPEYSNTWLFYMKQTQFHVPALQWTHAPHTF